MLIARESIENPNYTHVKLEKVVYNSSIFISHYPSQNYVVIFHSTLPLSYGYCLVLKMRISSGVKGKPVYNLNG